MKVSISKGMTLVCPCGTPLKLDRIALDGVFYFACPSCSQRAAWVPPEHGGAIESDWVYGPLNPGEPVEVQADTAELEEVAQEIRARLTASAQ